MAVESLDLAIRALGVPIYVYHEIVHNKYVVEQFQHRGAVFVDHLEDVPEGSNLLFRPTVSHLRSETWREIAS